MWLSQPKLLKLSQKEKNKVFHFGSPVALKEGVELTDKQGKCTVIYSLYEMEQNVKYVTQEGFHVRRVNGQVIIKKKAKKNREREPMSTATPQLSVGSPMASNPMNIPVPKSNNNNHGRRSLNRCSIETDPIPETFDNSFTALSVSPCFEDFAILPKKKEDSNTAHFDPITVDIQTENIPGEKIDTIIQDVLLVRQGLKSTEGTVYITNYQLIFSPTSDLSAERSEFENEKLDGYEQNDFPQLISIPLTSLARFEKIDRTNSSFSLLGESSYSVDIFSKDFRRTMRLAFDNNKTQRVEFCNLLMKYIFPHSLSDIFACSSLNAPQELKLGHGWLLYDPFEEYKRMGVFADGPGPWSFSKANADFLLCDTYPPVLVVPSSVTSDTLLQSSSFRSRKRIPVLSWRNNTTGVSLCRCSQPLVGVTLLGSYRSKADEDLIKAIQATNPLQNKLYILDARPMANAIGNMALGGGYENVTNYPNCEIDFLGIANIHSVRESWNKLRDLCEQQADDKGSCTTWYSQLEATHWFEYLGSILAGANRIAQLLAKNYSVLVHCSDGWDRTPQVCSLAQLLVDKEYRTTKGFCILIEKEWLQFGHKFAERVGINLEEPTFKDTERSPVFLQFLDATYQLTQQFPQAFEFTEDLLVQIMLHVYSSRFGTFLLNSARERREAKLHETSPSLWKHIMERKEEFSNPFYLPSQSPCVLTPTLDIKNMKFWSSYYLCFLQPNHFNLTKKFNDLGKQMSQTTIEQAEQIAKLEKEKSDLLNRIKVLEQNYARGKVHKQSSSPVSFNHTTSMDSLTDDWVNMQ